MEYLIGYTNCSTEALLNASLLGEIRYRLSAFKLRQINQKMVFFYNQDIQTKADHNNNPLAQTASDQFSKSQVSNPGSKTHKCRFLVDAAACPQVIAYSTDLNLLNDARLKSEQLMNQLFQPGLEIKKPTTYQQHACKNYLRFARNLGRVQFIKAVPVQIHYLRRNIGHVYMLVDYYATVQLKAKENKNMLFIQKGYQHQLQMWNFSSNCLKLRIVSVQPVVWGKARHKTKIGQSWTTGFNSNGINKIKICEITRNVAGRVVTQSFHEAGIYTSVAAKFKKKF